MLDKIETEAQLQENNVLKSEEHQLGKELTAEPEFSSQKEGAVSSQQINELRLFESLKKFEEDKGFLKLIKKRTRC